MKNGKKSLIYIVYLVSIIVIVFLTWWISIFFKKCLDEYGVQNWWHTRQSENFVNQIQELSLLEQFIELEEVFLLEEMIKKYSKTHLQKLHIEIYKETIQLIKIHYADYIYAILHFSTNIISIIILIGYSIILGNANKKLVIINFWVQELLYKLNDTIKAFSILLITDLCIGFHSPYSWELIIVSVYNNFGFVHNDQIIYGLVSTFPVILDTILKYWIFRYLNYISPSLVVIYHSIND